MTFDLRPCSIGDVCDLCEQYHSYGSASNTATYAFAVYESARIVAAYAWQPPPFGAARNACPEAPAGVLALSRMVAVDRKDRALRHVSKPLRVQMRRLIDRGRWPVLITYSDEGEGHTGHVYKCSGWTPTLRGETPVRLDPKTGARASRYCAGVTGGRVLDIGAPTTIQRWEHWACQRGKAAEYMAQAGWRRESTGERYTSGRPAFTWTRQLPLFGSEET